MSSRESIVLVFYGHKPLVRCSGESWACQKGTGQAVGVGFGSRVAVAACHHHPHVFLAAKVRK